MRGADLPLARVRRSSLLLLPLLCAGATVQAAAPVGYLQLPEPQRLTWPAQDWEGDQQPHTLSVIELNRGGFRYWGWYGLNHGRGIGLARSNDLVHWNKYEGNLTRPIPSGFISPSRATTTRPPAASCSPAPRTACTSRSSGIW